MASINQYIRYIWFVFNCIFHVIFIGIPCYIIMVCIKPFYKKEALHKCISYLGCVYFKICLWASGIKIHIYGIENMDDNQHYIYMSNHTSICDVPILYASVLPYDVISIYKSSLVQEYPIFGWLLHNSANIPIDKNNTDASINNMNTLAADLCKNKSSVLIFPEGKISNTKNMNSFKTGGSILAIKTGISILPIAICGCQDIIGNFSINTEYIKMIVGKPIITEGLDYVNDKHKLTQQVFDTINTLKTCNSHTEPYIIALSFFDCFIPKIIIPN